MNRLDYINFLYDKGIFNSNFTLCRLRELYKHHETGKVIRFLRKTASYLLREGSIEDDISSYGYMFLERLKKRRWVTVCLSNNTIEEQREFFFSRILYQLILMCKPFNKKVQGWVITELIKTVK